MTNAETSVKKPIITTLKRAFAIGLLFMSLISLIGLFAWYQQARQVNYLLDDYLPQIHLERQLEEQIGLFINELNHFGLVREASLQPFYFRRLNQQLDHLEKLVEYAQNETAILSFPIEALRKVISDIDKQISVTLAIEQKKQEVTTKIYWLSDDFNTETIELIQELSQQQLSATNANARQSLQDELQSIYYLSYQEFQLKNELLNIIYQLDKTDVLSEFEPLKQRLDYTAIHLAKASNHASMMTLEQILQSLFNLVQDNEAIGQLVAQIKQHRLQSQQLLQRQNALISDIRQNLLHALENKKAHLHQFHHRIKTQTHLLGGLTFGLFTLCLLLLLGFNHFYLKRRLTQRFSQLIQSVAQLNQGKFSDQIQLTGNDELAQISRLLQTHVQIVQERVKIAQELVQTQNELIQAGKLAIVGQTITTISHEINQPLNAMSIYLYTLKKWVNQNDPQQALVYIDNITRLTERISNIIKQLRFFTRRSDAPLELKPITLKPAIETVWQLLENRHQSLHARLQTEGDGVILADSLLLEQVLSNLIINALEAKGVEDPVILCRISETNGQIRLEICDNGKGWQLDDPTKLMQPFYTNKAVGLGLGLPLCQHIMTQFGGSITLASTLNRHALIILEFRKP
ncbi:TPA: ATP-binding protein [Mannheimia haemolytica]